MRTGRRRPRTTARTPKSTAGEAAELREPTTLGNAKLLLDPRGDDGPDNASLTGFPKESGTSPSRATLNVAEKNVTEVGKSGTFLSIQLNN